MKEPANAGLNGWTPGLFDDPKGSTEGTRIELAEDAYLLPGLALADAPELHRALLSIAAQSNFRHLVTPGGHRMSVAMTNCGSVGWTTTERGYVYAPKDPATGRAWPPIPPLFETLGQRATQLAGFAPLRANACVVNRYEPGTRLTLHQDKDEQDLTQPIVSVSLGLPAVFLLGGFERSAPTLRRRLEHGDVVVWGGASRLRFHGVLPIEPGSHPVCGPYRYNLTFRAARFESRD